MLNGTRLIATTASDDTTTVTVINTAPFVHNTVVAPATVGDPDPVTGVVVGKINATDPEDPLSYTVTTAPTNGDVTIDGAGVFTYTPTAAARRAAAASLGPDIDGFIVTVGDGHGGQVVSMVTVDIAPAGVLGQTAVAGTPSTSGATVGPNGTRAVQVTLDSAPAAVPRVVVIDTVTGLQVGETVMLPTAQSVGVPVFNAGGSRVAVVTSGFDAVLGTTLSSVSVIDTGSGEQVGETVTVTGESFFGVQFSALGGKAAMATVDSQGEVRVTVLDAVSGALIGTTQGVTGTSMGPVQFSSDGGRAYQIAGLYGPDDLLETRIVVVDTATGAQVGDPLFFAGVAAGGLQLFGEGDRALQTIDTGAGATRIYTIDLATATVIGVPIELVGSPAGLPEGNAVLNEDGTRAVQLMLEGSTTRVVVIDTTPATGAVVVNDATTVTGLPASSVRFSDDESRVVVTTRTTTGGGGPSATTTRVAVVEVGTGDQLGVTYQVNGLLQRAVEFSPDDDSTRLVLLTRSSVGSANVVVTVLDADTGLVVGAPISLGGAQTGVTFSADGHRLFATSATGTTTRVTSVNLVDGSSASVSLGIGVPVGALVIGSDGQTAFQTVIVTDAGTQSTRLAIVDLSGAPTTVGVIALEGAQPTFGEVKSMLNGTRLIATTASDDTTTVTVINTAPFLVDSGTSL